MDITTLCEIWQLDLHKDWRLWTLDNHIPNINMNRNMDNVTPQHEKQNITVGKIKMKSLYTI